MSDLQKAIRRELHNFNTFTTYYVSSEEQFESGVNTCAKNIEKAVLAALDDEPDHFYLATWREVDESQTTDIEPVYRHLYTIVSGPAASPLDAWDGGLLPDGQWDNAVVLGFKGTKAVAAYYDHEDDDPVVDGLDAERAQEALHERVSFTALDEEPPLEDVLRDGDVQRIMLYRIRHESPPRWSAYVQAGHCGPDDPQGIGIEGDPVVAIRAAVQHAKEQG